MNQRGIDGEVRILRRSVNDSRRVLFLSLSLLLLLLFFLSFFLLFFFLSSFCSLAVDDEERSVDRGAISSESK